MLWCIVFSVSWVLYIKMLLCGADCPCDAGIGVVSTAVGRLLSRMCMRSEHSGQHLLSRMCICGAVARCAMHGSLYIQLQAKHQTERYTSAGAHKEQQYWEAEQRNNSLMYNPDMHHQLIHAWHHVRIHTLEPLPPTIIN